MSRITSTKCRTAPSTGPSSPTPLPDFDDGDLKDVFWPDVEMLPGETSETFRLRCHFTFAGYRVRKVEESETHPVLVVRAVRTTGQRFPDPRQFRRHIRGILKQAGFRVKSDDLTVNQTGDRILAAFIWPSLTAWRKEVETAVAGEFDPIPI